MDRDTILNKLEEYAEQITNEIYDTENGYGFERDRYDIYLDIVDNDSSFYKISVVPNNYCGLDNHYSVYLGCVGGYDGTDPWSYQTFETNGYVDNWDVIGEIAGSDITKTEDGWLYKDEEYYDYYDMANTVIEDNQEYWKNFIEEYNDWCCYLYRDWWDKAVEHFNEDWKPSTEDSDVYYR